MQYLRRSAATWVRCLFFLTCVIGFAEISNGGTLLIQGQVVGTNGNPLDGCLISIAMASASQQRSRGVLTEEGGKFEVPFAPGFGGDSKNIFPYLEIYWGETLIFRQPLPSLRIERGNLGSSANVWNLYLTYGGEVTLSPISVSR